MRSRIRVVTLLAALTASTGAVIAAPATTDATAAVSSASGVSMPGTYLSTWKRTFSDDFSGSTLNAAHWQAYNGDSKSSSVSSWRAANVVVSNGVANLYTVWNGKSATSGAIASAVEGGQAYGKWVVRLRVPKAAGVNYVVALYPIGGGWPPEVDFAEDGGGDRSHILATLHYSPANAQIHRTLTGIDFSQWHTVGVIMTPGHIKYTIDGKVWAEFDGAEVPSQKMWLVIQTGITNCTAAAASCAGPSTPSVVDTQVDWVARYTAR